MGRRKKESSSLTPLELELMQVLWREGPANVQDVQKALGSDLAYTTVQTMLNVLHQKGRVRRRLNGRAYEYRAVNSRDSVVKQAIADLVQRMFGGSSEDLVMSLVKSRQIDPERLEDLAKQLRASAQEAGDE